MSVTLTTERLTLRIPKFEDFEHFRACYQSQRMKYAGGPIADLRQSWNAFSHLAGMWLLRGYGTFIVTITGRDTPVGAVGPYHPINWPERELGWTCWDETIEGTGVIFEAASAARDHAFGSLGWDTAVSYIHPDNSRSIRLAERLGAVLDRDADQPSTGDLVYRHPKPEAV